MLDLQPSLPKEGPPRTQATPLERGCVQCGETKPVSAFRPHRRACRGCEHNKQQARKVTRYAKNAEIHRRKKLERHSAIARLKAVPCADCKKSFAPYVMDFDHLDRTTKRYEISQLINKSSAPWSRVLEEVAKCDVVCVCCHRLRTWVPGTQWNDNRRRLIVELKNRPCEDCKEPFHFSQMDFDHVRGIRIGPVPHMRSRQAILDEAAKCEVVCANCHRERTQRRTPSPRLDAASVNMVWERRTRDGVQTQVAPSRPRQDAPAFRPWHPAVGTMLDTAVAERFGVSPASVCLYRKRMAIPKFRNSL